MSFYNFLFSENCLSDVLLKMLDLDRRSVGRFRDCYLQDGKIAVYTRNGGNNRKCWNCEGKNVYNGKCDCPGCTITYRLPENPYYLWDEDDEFDSTYATIYFSFPDKYKEILQLIDSETTITPEEKWKKLFEEMNSQT